MQLGGQQYISHGSNNPARGRRTRLSHRRLVRAVELLVPGGVLALVGRPAELKDRDRNRYGAGGNPGDVVVS